jgi:AraC family transcriptional regulator
MEFKTIEAIKLAGMPHKGSYYKIGGTWEQFAPKAAMAGLFKPGVTCLSVYFSNPMEVPEDQLRSAACVQIQPDEEAPEGLESFNVCAGKYAVVIHKGPYEKLGETWGKFCGELANNPDAKMDPTRPCFEVYLNDPQQTAPQDLLTELYEPVVE